MLTGGRDDPVSQIRQLLRRHRQASGGKDVGLGMLQITLRLQGRGTACGCHLRQERLCSVIRKLVDQSHAQGPWLSRSITA